LLLSPTVATWLVQNEAFKASLQGRSCRAKILIIFCCYVLLGVIGLTTFTITTQNATLLADAVADYWQCEITGVDPENSCDRLRDLFEALTYPGLTSVTYFLLGIFPAVNLIFAVNIEEIKQKFRTWCGRAAKFHLIEERSSTSTPTATSTYARNKIQCTKLYLTSYILDLDCICSPVYVMLASQSQYRNFQIPMAHP